LAAAYDKRKRRGKTKKKIESREQNNKKKMIKNETKSNGSQTKKFQTEKSKNENFQHGR